MSDRRGFTLIELLMVLLIIGIVIAIVVPALGGARNAAKSAATQRLLTDFVSASSTFRNDHQGRAPGFFSAREMGSTENEAYGLSAMENAMLELSGGLSEDTGEPNILTIDFLPSRTAYVNPDLVGTGDYFEVDRAHFESQQSLSQIGTGDHVGLIPDLVDAWGNPILLWVNDEFGPRKIETVEDFARPTSGAAGNDPTMASHFYWASNACFLNSARLGELGKDQTQGAAEFGSLIGGDYPGDMELSQSMAAVLGNPSFPDNRAQQADMILPTAPRGQFVVHSAGTDGVFVSKRDRGGKPVGEGPLVYGMHFKTGPSSDVDLVSDAGQVETRDLMSRFDDLVQSGGN